MTLVEEVLSKLRSLPRQRQEEVLAFVNRLQNTPKGSQRSLLGLWSDLNVNISDADLAEARSEIWAAFPRDFS